MADIKKLESELWEAADDLRANSKLTSQQYCMPVLGPHLPALRVGPLQARGRSDRRRPRPHDRSQAAQGAEGLYRQRRHVHSR